MAKTLWGMYDGEPFMENPHLGLLTTVNPHKKGKKMAAKRRRRKGVMPAGLKRYWAARRGRKNAPARKRRSTRRRRNWLSPGMVVAANPHRRRRSRARSANPKRRHHRRHRNPAFMGLTIPPIKSVVFAGIGFAGPAFVSGFVSTTFPSVMTQLTSMGLLGKYILKVGSILGLTMLTKRFVGVNEGNMVLIGGGVNVALSAVNDFAPGILPANPLGMYVPNRTMAAYVPNRGMRGLNSAPAVQRIPSAAPFRNLNGSKFGVASRLMRY